MIELNNLVFVSDLHAGCQFGLCPPGGVRIDGGGLYQPSDFQIKLWDHWLEFWSLWVPSVVHSEPYGVVVNGDAMDNEHHHSTTQISHNMADQERIAEAILAPVVERCKGRFWFIRGTEAHAGKSGCDEERLARKLNALPDASGNHSRFELWKRVGPSTVHALHHISTTGSQHYESTAVCKELLEAYTEGGRWASAPPDFIVRSHRHRQIKVSIPTARGDSEAIVTAGWQGKTPFAFRISGARQTQPQFGGAIVRHHAKDKVTYIASRVWTLKRPEVE